MLASTANFRGRFSRSDWSIRSAPALESVALAAADSRSDASDEGPDQHREECEEGKGGCRLAGRVRSLLGFLDGGLLCGEGGIDPLLRDRLRDAGACRDELNQVAAVVGGHRAVQT